LSVVRRGLSTSGVATGAAGAALVCPADVAVQNGSEPTAITRAKALRRDRRIDAIHRAERTEVEIMCGTPVAAFVLLGAGAA